VHSVTRSALSGHRKDFCFFRENRPGGPLQVSEVSIDFRSEEKLTDGFCRNRYLLMEIRLARQPSKSLNPLVVLPLLPLPLLLRSIIVSEDLALLQLSTSSNVLLFLPLVSL